MTVNLKIRGETSLNKLFPTIAEEIIKEGAKPFDVICALSNATIYLIARSSTDRDDFARGINALLGDITKTLPMLQDEFFGRMN